MKMEKIFAKIKNFIIGPYPYEKNMTLYVLKRIVWLGTLIASIRYWFLLIYYMFTDPGIGPLSLLFPAIVATALCIFLSN